MCEYLPVSYLWKVQSACTEVVNVTRHAAQGAPEQIHSVTTLAQPESSEMSRSSPVITETIPFMDDRNTPRPSKKPFSTTPQRASTPTKKPSPPSRKGAVQNGVKAEENKASKQQPIKTENKSSPRPGTASARAAMVSAPNSAPPKKKSPEPDPSPAAIDKSKVPAYTPRNKSFRPKPRPTKQKAPQPPSAPVSPTSSKPFQPKITANKDSPKKDTTPTRNVIKPPPKSFSVDPLDIARNYPLQAPRPSRSSNPITSTNIGPVAPPPLASPGNVQLFFQILESETNKFQT